MPSPSYSRVRSAARFGAEGAGGAPAPPALAGISAMVGLPSGAVINVLARERLRFANRRYRVDQDEPTICRANLSLVQSVPSPYPSVIPPPDPSTKAPCAKQSFPPRAAHEAHGLAH